jgi:hypothetical protein
MNQIAIRTKFNKHNHKFKSKENQSKTEFVTSHANTHRSNLIFLTLPLWYWDTKRDRTKLHVPRGGILPSECYATTIEGGGTRVRRNARRRLNHHQQATRQHAQTTTCLQEWYLSRCRGKIPPSVVLSWCSSHTDETSSHCNFAHANACGYLETKGLLDATSKLLHPRWGLLLNSGLAFLLWVRVSLDARLLGIVDGHVKGNGVHKPSSLNTCSIVLNEVHDVGANVGCFFSMTHDHISL